VNNVSAAPHPTALQTSQALMAISRYSTVHTGPKIQSDGVQSGRCSPAYQVFTEPVVNHEPIAATAKHSATKGSNDSQDWRSNIVESLWQSCLKTEER